MDKDSGVAHAGTRSFYLDDYADEVLPCGTSLQEWADWLASPPVIDEEGEAEWGRAEAAKDGDTFKASAIAWQEDIIARRVDGEWTLSRDPGEDDFLAIRFTQGSGWDADSIVIPGFDPTSLGFLDDDTNRSALLRLLEEGWSSDEEYVAVGTNENGWLLTFRAPASLEAERVQ